MNENSSFTSWLKRMPWSCRILHLLGELHRFASNQLFKYATVYDVIHYVKATYQECHQNRPVPVSGRWFTKLSLVFPKESYENTCKMHLNHLHCIWCEIMPETYTFSVPFSTQYVKLDLRMLRDAGRKQRCAEFSCKTFLSFIFRINYWSWCWVDNESSCVADTAWPVKQCFIRCQLCFKCRTPWTEVLVKLSVAQLIEKGHAFYGIWRFTTVLNFLPVRPLLSQLNSVHTLTSCFSEIQLNIILESVLASSKLSLPYRFFRPRLTLFTSLQYVLYVLPISPELPCSFALYLMESRLR